MSGDNRDRINRNRDGENMNGDAESTYVVFLLRQ